MSETRTSHIVHRKKESTVFPADFFCETRASDPSHKYPCPKINLHKISTAHCGVHEKSPRKVNTLSDSTSAYSKENELEDLKFPEISKAHLEEVVYNFINPLGHKTSARNKLNLNDKSNGGIMITEKNNNLYRALLNYPFNCKASKGRCMEINRSHAHIHEKFSSPSSKSKCSTDKNSSMNKSNSIAKYNVDRCVDSSRGYDSKYKSNPKRIYSSNNKISNLNMRRIIDPDEIKEFNILHINDLDSDEDNSLMFDPISDDTFEELCKLADEPSTLPNIFENKKLTLEATFQFCKEDYENDDKESEGYLSFDKILKNENSHQYVANTVQHHSSKAKDLNLTPFVMRKNPSPEYCQKTAYFGNEQ